MPALEIPGAGLADALVKALLQNGLELLCGPLVKLPAHAAHVGHPAILDALPLLLLALEAVRLEDLLKESTLLFRKLLLRKFVLLPRHVGETIEDVARKGAHVPLGVLELLAPHRLRLLHRLVNLQNPFKVPLHMRQLLLGDFCGHKLLRDDVLVLLHGVARAVDEPQNQPDCIHQPAAALVLRRARQVCRVAPHAPDPLRAVMVTRARRHDHGLDQRNEGRGLLRVAALASS